MIDMVDWVNEFFESVFGLERIDPVENRALKVIYEMYSKEL